MGVAGILTLSYFGNRSDYNNAKDEYENATFENESRYNELWDEYKYSQEDTNKMATFLGVIWILNIADSAFIGWNKVNLSVTAEPGKTMINISKNF